METPATNDTVSASIQVDEPRERAFYAFSQQMTSWWPREYSWSGAGKFGHISLEPEEGADWYEVDAGGTRQADWGRLLAWEPPERIVLTWQIGARRQPETDPSHASEVEVRFLEVGGGTRVEVEHRGFARHGEAWEAYRRAMDGDEGWPKILGAFAEYFVLMSEQFGVSPSKERAS
jgi:uncharacterized protein YndB with AHSA1/START domain